MASDGRGAPLTARDLLASSHLRPGRLLGGAAGLDVAVRDVVLTSDGRLAHSVRPSTAAVLDLSPRSPTARAAYRQHLSELLCHRLRALGGSMLVLAGDPAPPAASTGRVADRLALPVVAIDSPAAADLTARLLGLVWTPELLAARSLSAAARLIHAGSVTPDGVLAGVAKSLAARVALTSADGTVVAGDALPVRPAPGKGRPCRVEVANGVVRVWCPLSWPEEANTLWLTAEAPGPGPVWERVAVSVLELAAGHLTGWLAVERLRAERDSRYRSTLLAEIIEAGPSVTPPIVERAATIGWRVDGWHTGVHLARLGESPEGPLPPLAAELLGEAISEAGAGSGIVERIGGWSAWFTDDWESSGPARRRMVVRLQRALAAYHAHREAPPMVAGLGPSQRGPAGLASSLAEGRQACLVSVSRQRKGAVLPVEELGGKRLLVDWYSTPALRDSAVHLLAPLADAGPELLETLEVYLDRGRSSSATAAALGLHRNTVSQRVRRAEQLLGMELDDPDDALALQVAGRLVRLGRSGESDR